MEKRKSRARAAAGANGGGGEERGTRRAELVLFCRPGRSLTSGQTDGPPSRSALSSSSLLPVNYALLFFVNALVDENPALVDEKSQHST